MSGPPTAASGALAATPFIGRARELSVLEDALARANGGSGGAVLLVGEPGIGKTRLADEFSRRARAAGAEVLSGRCFEGPGAPAYWPWTQIVRAYARDRDATRLTTELGNGAAELAALFPELRNVLPALGAPPEVNEQRARMRSFEAVTAVLATAAARQPLVLILEDLQGADRASLVLLDIVARAIRTERILILGTCRAEALVPKELIREAAGTQLDLVGLDRNEVGEFLQQVTGAAAPEELASLVHRRTEGNPLYVSEVARTLPVGDDGRLVGGTVASVPATVRSAIAARLGALSAEAYESLAVAAMFGRVFSADALARAVRRPIDALSANLEEAVAARIVTAEPGEPGRYRFAHALFAEILTAVPGEARRVALHRAVAAALAGGRDADHKMPEIAHHYFAAGPGGDAVATVHWTQRAADEGLAKLAYEEAADWYQRALAALGWLGAEASSSLQAELLLGLGNAIKRAGGVTDARPTFEQAAVIGRALGSAEMVTRAALGFAPTIAWSEDAWPDPAVIELLEEAVESWQGRATALHARALTRLGMAMMFGDADRRARMVAAGVAMARTLGDAAALRDALAAFLASYQVRYEVEHRLAIAGELVALATAARDLEPLAMARTWRCVHLIEVGDIAGSVAELVLLEALDAEIRQPAWQWHLRLPRAVHAILRGRFREAAGHITAAYDVGVGVVAYAAEAYRVGQEFMLKLLRGDPDDAAYRGVYGAHPDPVALSPLAWSAVERGDAAEARAWMERFAPDDFAIIRSHFQPPVPCMFLAEACAFLGDRGHAESLIGVLSPYARYWVVWAEGLPLGPMAHPFALLLRTVGRVDEAAQYFEHAIAESRRVDAPPFLARALYEYARLLADRQRGDDVARSAAMLAECRAIAVAIGMEGLVRKVDGAPGVPRGAPSVAPSEPAPERVDRAVFHRDGGSWLITYEGRTIRLHGTRGLAYLATLLHHPGREFPVVELIADDARAAAATVPERARQMVSKGIGSALVRIADVHPSLGRHLRATVKRGAVCAYVPDTRRPIVWER